ncbi:tRNA (adenosine(37)-N6)-threonylcarbamoyltransferase complex ATPase subunit type 1 TsaE [Thiomicrorhabdus sp.]|uniref:tRNA (adenosine(37)-N6)-threonylcarbamoyltransferase complex ATPase subunit type 1 TsaE n=1 Tax=Thiomicrorhabdus sp. TaxID=2039724 RepID=UPI0029C9B203|nr:tRNA (adenosine(37)-N6)-threonylcarbamoyltransferase complex ATPase subunit type 1 TsaE [Thiomicrorhabdus sp.]
MGNRKREFVLDDSAATQAVAQAFARACEGQNLAESGLMVYLQGELGAGKSCFSRAFIQAFLPGQKVKSPTYTLIESYSYFKFMIHHLDLYRLCDPEELEYLAVRELFSGNFIALVEWPSKGRPILPASDVSIELLYEGKGRRLKMHAQSEKGMLLLDSLPV